MISYAHCAFCRILVADPIMAEKEQEKEDSNEAKRWKGVQLFSALTTGNLDMVKALAANDEIASQRFSFGSAADPDDGNGITSFSAYHHTPLEACLPSMC